MKTSTRFAVALLFTIPACGGSKPPAATPETHAAHEAHEGHEAREGHHEHQAMPGPVKDLHDVLAPVWHMPKGPDRAAKICTHALSFHDKSVAIHNAAVPAHAKEAGWKAGAAELVQSSKELVAECEMEGRPELETRFAAFHQRFHKLAEQVEH